MSTARALAAAALPAAVSNLSAARALRTPSVPAVARALSTASVLGTVARALSTAGALGTVIVARVLSTAGAPSPASALGTALSVAGVLGVSPRLVPDSIAGSSSPNIARARWPAQVACSLHPSPPAYSSHGTQRHDIAWVCSITWAMGCSRIMGGH